MASESSSSYSPTKNDSYHSDERNLEDEGSRDHLSETYNLYDTSTETEMSNGLVVTPFPRLAPELRQKLWKEACCVSRIVDIWATPIGGKECREFITHFFDTGTYFYKTDPHGTPAILHTSREARTIGLEHYILSFGSAFTGAIGTASVQITSPPKIWVNWDCDTIFPMKTFNDNLDDNRAGYFMSNIIHDELQGKGASSMAFDIDNKDSPLWGSQFAANSNSTCQEVIVHCGFDAISQRFHSHTPVELDIINLSLGEDMEKKLGEADMDHRLNIKFVVFNALWEDAKRIHRSTNGIGKAGGAEPAEDWDPVLKFVLIVARKT